MPWVRFTADFDFTPPKGRRVTFAYRAGVCERVTQACAAAAIAKGRAEPIPTPRTRADANAVRMAVPQPGADT